MPPKTLQDLLADQQREASQRIEDKLSADNYDKQLGDMASTPYFSTPQQQPSGSLLSSFLSRPADSRVSGELPQKPEDKVRAYVKAKAAEKQPASLPDQTPYVGPKVGDGSDLRDAQGSAARGRLIAGLGEAFDQVGRGIAKTAPDKSDFYKRAGEAAGAPVTDLLQRRDQDQKQFDWKQKLELNDPANPQNQAFRDFILKAMPEAKGARGFDQVTMANPGPFEKILQYKLAADARKEAAAQAALSHQLQRESLNNERTYKHMEGASKALHGDKEYTKALEAANSSEDALKTLEEARFNPIANGAKAVEMARAIVGGGRINTREIEALGGSKALRDRLEQGAKELESGTMTDRNYQFYKQLINTMQQSAQAHKEHAVKQYVDTYSRRTNKPYSEAYADVMGKYPDAQQPAPGSQPVANPQQTPSAAPQQQPSPQDAQAIEWAKANPTDPRASKILQLHGLN